MTKTQRKAFLNLCFRLEPEWLTCDGELSRSQVDKRWRSIMKEWGGLELQVGRKVTQDEIWAWYDGLSRAGRKGLS